MICTYVLNYAVLYADDSTAYVLGDFLESMVSLVKLDLEKTNNRLCVNKLSLNVGKSLFIIFSSETLAYYPHLFISGNLVPFEIKQNF